MSFEAYLFDLDGTLVDTAPDLNDALNHALTNAGLEGVDEALTRHWVGHGALAMLEAAFAHHGHAFDSLDEHLEVLLDFYGAHIADRSRIYPGVIETLEVLSARMPCAVVTNKRARLTEPLLKALDLGRYFQTIVSGDTAEQPKPDAAPALLACERMGCDASRVLFVGDSTTDVACARAAGCEVVIYRYGYNHGIDPEHMDADAVIDSLSELV